MNQAKRNAVHAECIEVYQSPLHADGVRAVAPISQHSTVYVEKPHYFLQSLPNRRNVLACGCCARFLGTVGLQLKVLQKCVTREELLSGAFMGISEPFESLSDAMLPCASGCGELYCSTTCRDLHWTQKGHKYLCTGQIGEAQADTHPLMAFKVHAVQTNEIFLMVADIFAELCALYEQCVIVRGAPRDEVLVHISEFFRGFVRQRWWDAALPPKGQSKAKFVKTLKKLVADSYSMLSDALPLEPLGLQDVLSEDFMARCVGMFEQNNVGVRLRSPVAALVAQATGPLAAALLSEVQAAASAVESECMDACDDDGDYEDVDDEEGDDEEDAELAVGEDDELDVAEPLPSTGDANGDAIRDLVVQLGEDELFPPLDGTAFYFLTCKINHSCQPNCIVQYTCLPGLGLAAQMTALRDIAPGEELLQSYVDADLPLGERQRQLAEYGFQCACTKCAVQAQGLAL